MSRPTNPPKVPQKPDFDTTGLVFDGWGWIPDPWADVVDEEVPPNNPPVNPPTDDDPATLRARLQERYERPERPCTYDPSDEEPEAEPVAPTRSHLTVEWKDTRNRVPIRVEGDTLILSPAGEPEVRFDGISVLAVAPQGGPPFTIHPDGSRWGRPRQVPPYSVANDLGWRNRIMDLPPTNTVGGSFPCVCGAILRWEGNPDTATNEDGTPHRCSGEPQGGPDPINPTDILYPCECGVRGIHACPLATRYPSDMFAAPAGPDPRNTIGGLSKKTFDPTWMDDMPVFRLGTKDKPGGFETFGEMRKRENPDPLRSYLRTLTNPDATPEDVNGALDALTPEDRALVSEALPSWGSARMSRVEAIAPFMARFETMVRERDPRANEEGILLLSALREDDPTRSTVEALMEIAKTPKVNP